MNSTLNALISDNTKMAKSLKHLKQIHAQQSAGMSGTQVDIARAKVEETSMKIEETQKSYFYNIMQIERLKTILKISDENKK